MSLHHKWYIAELHALSYMFSVAETLGRPISSTTFTQCALEATEVGEITQTKSH